MKLSNTLWCLVHQFVADGKMMISDFVNSTTSCGAYACNGIKTVVLDSDKSIHCSIFLN